jgi:trigger factor
LREQIRPRAERQVRAELLLDAFAQRETIDVTDDDVSGEIERIASRERQAPERVRAMYEPPAARAALREKLVLERALAKLVSAARVMPPAAAESVAHEK